MKKNYLSCLFLLLISSTLFAQYSVDFEDGNKSSYSSGTVTLNGIDWDMTQALIGSLSNDFFNDGQSARLRGYATSSITMLQDKANGVGNISFQYRQYGNDSQLTWQVEYSNDAGTSWNNVGLPFTPISSVETFSENVQANGNIRMRIVQAAGSGTSNARMNVDDIVITDFGSVVTQNDTVITFIQTNAIAPEEFGTIDLNLKLNQVASSVVTVEIDILISTNNILTNTFPETVIFPAGSLSEVVAINWLDDNLAEADEQIEFIIKNASSGSILGADSVFTLIIEDDDTPISSYDIATVTSVDVVGVPDSTGLECKLYGVVNSPERGFNSTEFSMQDATGAISVYQSGSSIAYVAAVGDSVEVIGEIDEHFGVTVITNISVLNLLSTGSTVTETIANMPMESNESSLLRVNGLQIVDPADWNAAGGAGFDVPVFTLSNDTFILRIDRDYSDLYNSADVPCAVFDVIGVAGQYVTDTPLVGNYQLLPRFLTDIIDTCTTVTPQGTIADATAVDPASGEPLLFGTPLTLKGIITSPDFRELQGDGTEFSFADATGGIWAYSTDSLLSYDPIIGDSVEVTGEIYASSGVTRIRISSVTNLGAATPFTPTVVTSALDESHEAELIKLEGLTLIGNWETSGGSYNVSASNSNGTYDIRVDADRAELFQPILSGGETFNLTGIGTQFDPTAPRTEGYQILPRFDSDIEIVPGGPSNIAELELANFSISPVPASETLTIQFDFDAAELAEVRLINVIGQVSTNEAITLVNGRNAHTIAVVDLNPGFYVLQIETSRGVSNTSVLIK